jgi:hypothetical protein
LVFELIPFIPVKKFSRKRQERINRDKRDEQDKAKILFLVLKPSLASLSSL